MQFTKMMGLAAVGAVLALAAPAERANALSLSNPGAAAAVQEDAKLAATEVHWRHTTIIGGTAGTIIIATTIIVTGVAGNCDNSARISHRPALLRACFDLKGRLETARLLPAIFVVWFNARSSS